MFQYGAFQGGAFQSYWVVSNNAQNTGGDVFYKKRHPDRRVEEETKERLALEKTISEIYDRINLIPAQQQQEVAEIVTGKKSSDDIALPILSALNVDVIMQDMVSIKRLMEIHKQMMIEEEVIILMLAL